MAAEQPTRFTKVQPLAGLRGALKDLRSIRDIGLVLLWGWDF